MINSRMNKVNEITKLNRQKGDVNASLPTSCQLKVSEPESSPIRTVASSPNDVNLNKTASLAAHSTKPDSLTQSTTATSKTTNDINNVTVSRRFCCECDREQPSNRLILSCECAQRTVPPRLVHQECLARQLRQSTRFDRCPSCQQPFDPSRLRVRVFRPGLLRYLSTDQKLHRRLVRSLLQLGFLLYLMLLSLVQYAQAQPLIYRHWAVLLLFLMISPFGDNNST